MSKQETWYRADDGGTVRSITADRETMWSLSNAREWMATSEAAVESRLFALRYAIVRADNAAESARRDLKRFEESRAKATDGYMREGEHESFVSCSGHESRD